MYLRKSRADIEAEARGEGETLARHEKILLDLAKKMKLNVTQIHREIVSGETISSRPVMQQLLNEVEQGIWDGVLVMEVERLARGDTIDQGIVAQTFKYSGTKIITPNKVYDPNNEFDEEYFEFGLFMSRREYKTINRRLQRGRIQSVKEGKYVGNKPPYGYVRKKLEKDKGYTLEPHPEQANIVKLIFDWYTKERIGVSKIVRRLNEMQAPTATGGDWAISSLRGILRNPAYIGKVRWNFRPQVKKVMEGEIVIERPRAKKEDWILVDGLHEPIIDKDTFELAQKYLSENPSVPAPKHRGIKNPLAGLIICGKCGRRMVRRPYNRRNQPDTLMCPVTSCDNVSSQLSLVEDKLLQALEIWLKNYKINIQAKEDNLTSRIGLERDLLYKAIQKLDQDIKTLKKQSESLYDLLEQGIYTTEIFLERSKNISNRIEAAEKNKKELEKQLEELSAKEKAKKEMIPKVEKVLEVYYDLKDPAEKNKLLKEIIEKVVYTKNVNGRWHNRPDDFELVLYPKLPK